MAIETPPAATSQTGRRILGMRCRNCGSQQPIGLEYVCPACFGPLEVAYDYAVIGASLTRETIAARAPGIWRYAELLPVDAPPARGLPVGSTPLLPADRLAPTLGLDRLWIKDDTRNPSLSFKDRAVAVAAARAVEFGVEALACASTGNLAGATAAAAAALGLPAYVFIPADLEPAKVDHALAYGATVVPIDGDLRRRQPALSRGGRRDRLGVRQHQPPPVLRRGLQDARLRDRRIARLAVAGRRRRSGRLRGDVHPGRPRVRGAGRPGPDRATADPVRRRPGCRVRPGRDGVGCRDRRHRARPDARHDRALAGHRQPGRRPIRRRAGERDQRLGRGDRGRGHGGGDPRRGQARGDLPGNGRRRDPGRRRGRTASRRHQARRRGRRPADRQRPQDPGRADARARRRHRPARSARSGARASGRASRPSSAGSGATREHGPHPADPARRDRRREVGRGARAARSARSWPSLSRCTRASSRSSSPPTATSTASSTPSSTTPTSATSRTSIRRSATATRWSCCRRWPAADGAPPARQPAPRARRVPPRRASHI